MSRRILICLLLVAVLALAAYFNRSALWDSKLAGLFAPGTERGPHLVYYCPMHPQVQSDKPGTCPICNMNLETMEPEKPLSASGQAASAKSLYYCPMHPQVQSDKPGTCPICNMNLETMDQPPDAISPTPTGPESLGTVRISPQKQQLIGVQLSEVTHGPLVGTIRAVGRVAYNEARISRIQTKIEGWIEQVFVDFTGAAVKKGQPLASVYSPQLFSTQRELIVARKSRDALAGSGFEEVASGAASLYDATRQRLKLWDISDAQIRDIEKRGIPTRAMTIFSPISGFVVGKNVYAGQRITPETELYTVADLSSIWVLADVYEYEIPMVRLGQSAVMTLAYSPGKTFKGTVSYIYPELDKTTRTLKVRLELPNSDLQLKPDMFANVEIQVDHEASLSVPHEAVLDSGMEQTVFVALDGGVFEPRKVRLGPRVGDRVILLSGLKAGDKVVTSGSFLIDSESQLKAAFKSMADGTRKESEAGQGTRGEEGASPKGAAPPGASSDHSTHRHP